MRVMVYPEKDGTFEVLVVRAPSAKLAPVLIRGASQEAVEADLREVLGVDPQESA